MYIAKLELVNWRSYQDTIFEFPVPTTKKPLVLIGAMNGHGKTSILLALYLGMFGKHATEYVQGFRDNKSEPYRKLIQAMRRRGADDNMEVRITFRAGSTEVPKEVHIIRSWYFNSRGQLAERGGEEVRIQLNDELLPFDDLDHATDLIAMHAFPDHVLPAFFFDGEQAQERVRAAGDTLMKKAVDILFGMQTLNLVQNTFRDCIDSQRRNIKGVPSDQSQVDQLKMSIDGIEKKLSDLSKERAELERERKEADDQFNSAMDDLRRIGGVNERELERLAHKLAEAKHKLDQEEERLRQAVVEISLPLAIGRLSSGLRRRLEGEKIREDWETARESTLSREGMVLAQAFPDPDPLLGPFPEELVQQLRDRVRFAITAIYEPPPDGIVKDYRFGHMRSESRRQVVKQIDTKLKPAADRIQNIAQSVRDARDRHTEASARISRTQGYEDRIREIQKRLDEAQKRIKEKGDEISKIEACRPGLNSELQVKRSELTRLVEASENAMPFQRRIDLAQRANDLLEVYAKELRQMTLERIEEATTRHFRIMADPRYRDVVVKLRQEGNPIILFSDGHEQAVQGMAGFEQRSFGIAFTLALAEVTSFRAPLVIDTPVGNADSDYRVRMLQHIANTGLFDQVILLSHNEEIAGKYYSAVKGQVAERFLVEFHPEDKTSYATPNRYF